MRRRSVGHMIAHTGRQDDGATISELGMQGALEAQEDVSLLAPMIRGIARGVFHHANAQLTELARSPASHPSCPGMLDRNQLIPRSHFKGYVPNVHPRLQ